MDNRILIVLLGATALTSAVPAFAQGAGEGATLGEVVVTARRTSENVQSIPVTVQAINGEGLQKYAVTQFTEVTKLAPGLQLSFASGSRGSNAEVTLRGVRWSSASGSVAIPIYINEVAVDPNFALLSLYDVGQLEILRGPQGTARGAPSISGAITVTPRAVNLSEFGGYASALVGNHDHTNFQGALNIPIITDKLGIRVAGLAEDSQGNRVHSLNNRLPPHVGAKSARVTVYYEPTDNLSVNLSYQYLRNINQTYDHVAGTGSPGFTTPAGATPGQTTRVLPPNYNGPPISTEDYLAVNDLRSDLKSRADIWMLNAKWDVAGHTLQYIGGFQQTKFSGPNSQDPGNNLIGYDPAQGITATGKELTTQELRLSSIPGGHMLDYVVGGYLYHNKSETDLYTTSSYLPGAFGAPGLTQSPYASPAAADRYRLPQFVVIPTTQMTSSVYASATLHLPWDTELTGGIRKIHDHRASNSIIIIGPGLGVTAAGAGGVCTGAAVSQVYGAGYCDRILVQQLAPLQFPSDQTRTPTIYNVSLSHKFTPDLLGYVTVGSSYRTPGTNIGVFVASETIRFPRPERSTSYEAGLKTTWLENRVRLNADIFQINYSGQLAQFPGTNYRNVTTGATAQTSPAFYQNADSRVRGFEAEVAFEPVRNLNLAGNAAYAKITSKGGLVPCNNPSVPLTATNEVNFCTQPSGVTLNTSPKFTATFNGEYVVPMDKFNGYARFNVAYRGKNPNYGFLASVPAYTLVDLFAGVRDASGTWEIGAYVKNAFNKKVELTRTVITSNLLPASGTTAAQFGQSGYFWVSATIPREIGVQLRYAFGSH